jgi:CheY-like chemotaxis protein
MFEQVDNATTRRHGGTGLGLAIASRLAALMDGRVRVESQVGRGSQFHFTARLGLGEGEPAEPMPPEPACLHGLRVLAVDDNATNRRILEEVLRSWQMVPATARDAAEALSLMRQAQAAGDPFRLVLTDAHMPHTDGFMLAEQIRQAAGLGSTVVMMLTSGDRPEDTSRCEEMGIAAYLLKPIKQSELLEAIQLALGVTTPKKVSHEPAEPPHVQGLRILLAEDSPVNQKLAIALLEGCGHQVVVAQNGQEAVAATESQSFDLILMDVQMPEMDGLEATAAIRNRERSVGTRIPIIAMTAYALKGDRERFLAAGMDGYVAKPIQVEALFDAIDALFPGRQTRTALRSAEPVSWTEALQALRGDQVLLRSLVEAGLEEIPHLMTTLREAVTGHDGPGLHRAAHTLKTSLRYFGAREAAEQALQLETLGREGRLEEAPPLVIPFAAEVERVQASLRTFLETAPPALNGSNGL